MEVKFGKSVDKYGPGVEINLTGDEVATAIDAYLSAHRVHVNGARTIRVNGELCKVGEIYVDPTGFVIHKGQKWSGRGKDPKYQPISNYKDSGMTDDNGVPILEGSVIIGDGYGKDSYYCVEFEDGVFGSCCYSDFEPISRYDSIIVKGHCTDFIEEFENGDWSGNLGAVIKTWD